MATNIKDFTKLAWYIQVAVVAGICAGLFGLCWYQYLSPMKESLVQKETELKTLQAQVLKSQQEERVFAKFKEDSEALKIKLESLKSILPQEKETDQILRQAQRSAESSALKIIRLGPRGTIDHEFYTEWPIDMEIVGTYHNIGTFLDKIRLLPRIVNISGMKIQSRASDGSGDVATTVGANYTATTFVYKEETGDANLTKVTVAK